MNQTNTLEPIVIDVETTTKNKGHVFTKENRLVSYSYDYMGNVFRYCTDPDFISEIQGELETCSMVVGFNIKFDLHWLHCSNIRVPQEVRVWDCQLAEHILNGQQSPYLSLNEALLSYGLPVKKDFIKENYWDLGIDTDQIPISQLEEYNKWDVQMTKALYEAQRSIMTPEQINLLLVEGEDMKTLIACERAGIKWDREGAQTQREALHGELNAINERLNAFLPDGIPAVPGFNWDSGDQLSALLYGGTIVYDYSLPEEAIYKSGAKKGETYIRNRWKFVEVVFPARFTPVEDSEVKKTKDIVNAQTRFYQTDDPTLQQLRTRRNADKALLETLRQRAAKIKILEMIDSIENKMETMGWEDNYIHGQYNQNVAITGRLSSSAPNMQNTPPEIDLLLISRYDS